MKRLLLSVSLLAACTAGAQTTIWTEDFENSCNAGCPAAGMNTVNGPWTVTNNSPALDACGFATSPNMFYVSCAENGNTAGACGTTCSGDESLHIGSTTLGDMGASYDAGGWCALGLGGWGDGTPTDVRAESPTIDLTGQSSITLEFVYMEAGQGTSDDATLWYYDGTTWSLLDALAKTSPCGAQGTWTAFSIALPASANGNPNVKIGFKWVNDDDGAGSDPSFAVDDVMLTIPGAPSSIATSNIAMNEWCYGTTYSDVLNFNATGTYNAGNVFTAEMSDAAGSFASPTAIGTLNSSSSGALSISIAVPGSMPTGTGYRMRVTASDPATVGSDNGADITIHPQPTVTLGTYSDVCAYTPFFTLTGGTPSGGTYSGPGVAAGSFDPAAAGIGTHTITYTYSDGTTGCSNTATSTIAVDECAGLAELDGAQFVIHPNPATESFTITSGKELGDLSIVDMHGRTVKKFDAGTSVFEVAELPSGVYVLKVNYEGTYYSSRLVIE